MSAHSARPPSGAHAVGQAPRLGRRMARVNRAVTNKLAVHVAGVLPGMGIVVHVGRRTRNVYRTPVIVFRTMDGFRIALTYGRDSDWVKNAFAHGAVRLITRRREYELTAPEVVVDEHRQHVPLLLRGALRVLRVSEFLDLRRASPAADQFPVTVPRGVHERGQPAGRVVGQVGTAQAIISMRRPRSSRSPPRRRWAPAT